MFTAIEIKITNSLAAKIIINGRPDKLNFSNMEPVNHQTARGQTQYWSYKRIRVTFH